MQRKITPGERFRQELMGSVSGSRESFSGYCRLAAQAMLQTAMEARTETLERNPGKPRDFRDARKHLFVALSPFSPRLVG